MGYFMSSFAAIGKWEYYREELWNESMEAEMEWKGTVTTLSFIQVASSIASLASPWGHPNHLLVLS